MSEVENLPTSVGTSGSVYKRLHWNSVGSLHHVYAAMQT